MARMLYHRVAAAPSCRRLLTLALFAVTACAGVAASAVAASAQTQGSPDLVISQVYTRGGEPGATFRNDYVEIFNRGNTTANLFGYTIQVLVESPPSQGNPGGGGLTIETIHFPFAPSGSVAPGRHLLIEFGSSGSDGAPTPGGGRFTRSRRNMPGDVGRAAIVRGSSQITLYGCPAGTDAALVDFFSYGATTCAEGPAVFAAPSATTAAFRNADGCTDTDSNISDFAAAAPNPNRSNPPAHPCNLAAPATSLQFEAATATVGEGAGSAEIFVTRTGDTMGPASVRYATSNDSAVDRRDYTTAFGTLDFAAGETRKSFRVLITDDALSEGDFGESLYLRLANPAGGGLGAQHIMRLGILDDDAAGGANPIDSADFFVRQHYADFLSRTPDEAGRLFWTQEIEQCGADAQCREVKRVNVSAAFFLSIEFQETGYFSHLAHKAAFPDNALSRPRGFPTYRELLRDAQQIGSGVIVGQNNWEQRLAANKQAYALEFVQRPEFLIRYPQSLTAAQFVDNLDATAGNPLSQAERDQQVANLTAANNIAAGRAAVLAAVVEDTDFRDAEFNRAFVLAQYFGYLRRNPFDGPDTDFTGYDFWLGKLNEFGGNYIRAEMVKAFISSDEYRKRFVQ